MLTRLVLLFALLAARVDAQPRTYTLQVVFVTYAENRSHTWTDPAVRGPQLIAQDNSFWNGPSASLGAITLKGTTYGWLDLNLSWNNFGSGCVGFVTATTAVLGAVPPNQLRVVVLPPLPDAHHCNSQAYGLIASGATILVPNGAYIEHETGHALGLQHSFQERCATTNGVLTCSYEERGGYSVMGQGDAINVYERMRVGAYSSRFQLATVTTSQDVTVQLANTMTPGIKGVTVPITINKPSPSGGGTINESHTLYAEYRAGDYVSKGVILWGYPNGVLIDLDRLTTAARRHLNVGETYCDGPYVCVTLVAQDARTAAFHFNVPGTTHNP